MKRRVILLTIATVVYIALGTLASFWILSRSTELVNGRHLKALVEDTNQLQTNVYKILLEQDLEKLLNLSETLDAIFQQASDQISDAFGAFPASSHAPLDTLKSQLQPFRETKAKITQSVRDDLEVQSKLKDLEFDFVSNFVEFLGSKEALRLPESQVTMSEAIMGILRARSEKEFVSARLLFGSTLSDYESAKIITPETVERLQEDFANYSGLKETLFTIRKERTYLTQDMIQILSTMKSSIELCRSIVEDSITRQVAEMKFWFLVASITLTLAFFGALQAQMRKHLVNPIIKLKSASQAVANGTFQRVEGIEQDDEIGELALHFNEMVKKLEVTVQAEKERTEQLSTITNNVTTGFCVVDASATVQTAYTQSCKDLFGSEFDAGQTIPSILRLPKRDADHFVLMVEQVFEEVFDDATALAQIPKKFEHSGKWLSIEPRVVRRAGGEIAGLLLTIIDQTELQAAKARADLNESLILLASERHAFARFITEFRDTVSELPALLRNRDQMFRVKHLLHTLKGNCSAFGLKDIAAQIHALEAKSGLNALDIYKVKENFKSFLADHFEVLKLDFSVEIDAIIEVQKDQLEELELKLQGAGGNDASEVRDSVLRWIRNVRLKEAGECFGALPALVKKLNDRFQKGVSFEFEGDSVPVDPERFSKLAQVLPHLIRNSFDHGIEIPEARKKDGKTEPPKIALSVVETDQDLVVTISDNGGGIDAERLYQKALQSGQLDSSEMLNEDEKLNLIFLDDLSAKDTVSEISGRGIGMSAVKAEVEGLGGCIRVTSQRGKGTSIEMRFPLEQRLLKIA